MAKIKEKKSESKSRRKNPHNITSVKNWWKTAPNILTASFACHRLNDKWTEEDAMEFAEALWEWSKKDSSLFIEDFLAPIGLTRFSFLRRVEKFEVLQHVYPLVKERIGTRQRYLALVGRIDAGMTKMHLRKYLEDYRPSVMYEEEWKREDGQRKEDKQHQKEMIKLRAKEAEGMAGELLKYFENKQVELPKLDTRKKDK